MPKIPLGLNARSFLPLSNAVNWRTGAIGGAALGGVGGLLRDPGTNPDGTPKSRLSSAAKGAIGGAAVGGGVGALNTRFVQPKLMKSVYGDKAPRAQGMLDRVSKMMNTPDEKLVMPTSPAAKPAASATLSKGNAPVAAVAPAPVAKPVAPAAPAPAPAPAPFKDAIGAVDGGVTRMARMTKTPNSELTVPASVPTSKATAQSKPTVQLNARKHPVREVDAVPAPMKSAPVPDSGARGMITRPGPIVNEPYDLELARKEHQLFKRVKNLTINGDTHVAMKLLLDKNIVNSPEEAYEFLRWHHNIGWRGDMFHGKIFNPDNYDSI